MSVFVSVFFVKQKTAYEMRISDWSSDVCSSDLGAGYGGGPLNFRRRDGAWRPFRRARTARDVPRPRAGAAGATPAPARISSAPDRPRPPHPEHMRVRPPRRAEARRVGQECDSGVDLGGRRIIKKKKNKIT